MCSTVPCSAYYLKNQPKAAQQLTIPPYIADAEEFGFCVKKGNTALLDKLNKAYAELKASGEVRQDLQEVDFQE